MRLCSATYLQLGGGVAGQTWFGFSISDAAGKSWNLVTVEALGVENAKILRKRNGFFSLRSSNLPLMGRIAIQWYLLRPGSELLGRHREDFNHHHPQINVGSRLQPSSDSSRLDMLQKSSSFRTQSPTCQLRQALAKLFPKHHANLEDQRR